MSGIRESVAEVRAGGKRLCQRIGWRQWPVARAAAAIFHTFLKKDNPRNGTRTALHTGVLPKTPNKGDADMSSIKLHPSHIFLLTALFLCIYIVVSHLD
jgi:hypothetical protein